MSTFLTEYTEHMNLPLYTCVTVLTLDSGEVEILDFVQGLWFVNSMEKLLIKPKQC